MKQKATIGMTFICGTITLFSLMCVFPLFLVVIVSISSEGSLVRNGIMLFPEKVSLLAYEYIFSTGASGLARSYVVTVTSTFVGTILAVLMTTSAGYALVSTCMKHKNLFAFYFFFSMLFSGGMVPWYMINTRLGLTDNFWALIIPSLLFNPYNMFLVRNFMKGIPMSLMESVRIDGANEFVIAFIIYFPLSLPVIAAIALFYGLSYWNSWWNAIMLINKQSLYPLQYMLIQIRSYIATMNLIVGSEISVPPTQPIQNATTLLTIGPILLLYPFLQKYFIKGIIIGAVKG